MEVKKYETNYNKGIIFNESIICATSCSNNSENTITINPSKTYQTFIGFGAALTDAAGYVFNQLPEDKKKTFLEECFTTKGLNYNFCRLSIGSSDFSTEAFSYSYKKDLSDFSIIRDLDTTLRLAKKAVELNPNMHFLSSPWSPPKFMKNTKLLTLGGKLLKKYRQTYADYICKYILEYMKNGIHIDYITIQNEPEAIQKWESCLYSAEEEADFAINYLHPTFIKNNISTKILVWDHNKDKLYSRASAVMKYSGSQDAISGFAFHWYTGDYFDNVEKTSNEFLNKLLIHSEGCTGFSNFNPNDEIKNAQMYGHDIIGDLNSGTNGYIDWNILLDNQGGPNHKKNFCNSPIMLNANGTDYIKNLTFTYIRHFSAFINPEAVRIDETNFNGSLETTAFKNKDNSIAIIFMNRNQETVAYNLSISGNTFHDEINGNSIVSYLI